MTKDIDQELAATLDCLDVLSPKPRIKEICTRIEQNPFYVSYKPTDLRLWQKGSERIKRISIQKKLLIKKPILQRIKSIRKSKGTDWLKCNLKDMECECSWEKVNCQKNATFRSAYSMSDLLTECDKVKEMEESVGGSKSDEISELTSYLDSVIHVPKKMSKMAESMYS